MPGSQHFLRTFSILSWLLYHQYTYQPTISLNENYTLSRKSLQTFLCCSHMSRRLKQQRRNSLHWLILTLFVSYETRDLVWTASATAVQESVWHSAYHCLFLSVPVGVPRIRSPALMSTVHFSILTAFFPRPGSGLHLPHTGKSSPCFLPLPLLSPSRRLQMLNSSFCLEVKKGSAERLKGTNRAIYLPKHQPQTQQRCILWNLLSISSPFSLTPSEHSLLLHDQALPESLPSHHGGDFLWFLRLQILQSSTDSISLHPHLQVSKILPLKTSILTNLNIGQNLAEPSNWTSPSNILSLLKSQPSFCSSPRSLYHTKIEVCFHWGVNLKLTEIPWNSPRKFRGGIFLLGL